MKKIFALVLAMMLVLGMTSAFAAGSIKLNDTNAGANSHDYKVYQIFTGTLEGTGATAKLTDVKYGKNFGNTGASVPKTELDAIENMGAAAYAASLEGTNGGLHGDPYATIKANTTLQNVPEGYYLIVDDTNQHNLAEGDAFSRYMIQVVKDVEIDVKKSGTTSDKEIEKDTLGATERDPDDEKIDNVSIGDTVKFTLTATVANDADTYNKYFFVMNDTLDAGFTFSEATANIVVTSTKEGKATLVKDTDYYVYTGGDCGGDPKHTFEIALADAKSFAGATITVNYQAVLNENCQMFEVPNKNTFYVTYSNNPKEDYSHEEDNDKPGVPSSTSTKPFGKTPDQHTETFTTGIKIKKVDQDGKSLAGATFTIEGTSLEKVVYYTEEFVKSGDANYPANATPEYYKLKNGSYTTDDPVQRAMIPETQETGHGYVVWDDATALEGDEKVTVNGSDYRVAHNDEAGTHTLQLGNTDLYETLTKTYVKIETKHVENKTAQDVSQTLTVGDDGILKFDGLGAGTYTIKEIAAPRGYTKIDGDISVTIEFVAEPEENKPHWKDNANYSKDADGYYTVEVENRAGNTLPSTGGIGTTIFYVAGSILVLAAAILLITKRRMSSSND